MSNGDPGRIRVLNDRLAFDDDGLETLRKELDEFEPEAIFIDPWVSFVPTDTRIKDSNAMEHSCSLQSSFAFHCSRWNCPQRKSAHHPM